MIDEPKLIVRMPKDRWLKPTIQEGETGELYFVDSVSVKSEGTFDLSVGMRWGTIQLIVMDGGVTLFARYDNYEIRCVDGTTITGGERPKIAYPRGDR